MVGSGADEGDVAALEVGEEILLEAQQRQEPVIWVGNQGSLFFPPDFAAAGLDLEALPIVRASDGRELARMADTLLRSGGFTVVVLDLDAGMFLTTAMQARLAGLAKHHHAVLLAIARKPSPLGSMVSLRGETSVQRAAFDRFTCELSIVKDKLRGPGWQHREVCRGPAGLC